MTGEPVISYLSQANLMQTERECVCVSVCVCVKGERERKERESERQRVKETERQSLFGLASPTIKMTSEPVTSYFSLANLR